ncbi:hypothetical protein GCM10011515_25200 [Tsuneonella deserti]|uniref:DUF2141 domain-containing protein n=1 Tax=Tsuneonella deserti TaxID=2035528 RepID=A0ABQ1SCE8_9SPHN|nr:DUF2141 domain-containing protein [Tsuneonella deserti]GGE04564.1 hypothetical protein GCM10011515_25200 [Tsuneonella deserti]
MLGLALAGTLLTGAGEPAGIVSLKVTGLRSDKGQVMVCLTREADRFPDCSGSATARTAILPANRPETTFAHLPQGRYAISVLHDENGNGRADKTLGLIPREGFGFSRDAPVRMGPPRFDQAAFAVAGEDVVQSVRMRYLM